MDIASSSSCCQCQCACACRQCTCICHNCSCPCHSKNDKAPCPSPPERFRFEASDTQVFQDYLLKKLNREPVPNQMFITDESVYAKHPSQLVLNKPQTEDGEWLFFSPRNPNTIRSNRDAGNGIWKQRTRIREQVLGPNGDQLGLKSNYRYSEDNTETGGKVPTPWYMDEFLVAGSLRKTIMDRWTNKKDFGFCRIYKKEAGGGAGFDGAQIQPPTGGGETGTGVTGGSHDNNFMLSDENNAGQDELLGMIQSPKQPEMPGAGFDGAQIQPPTGGGETGTGVTGGSHDNNFMLSDENNAGLDELLGMIQSPKQPEMPGNAGDDE